MTSPNDRDLIHRIDRLERGARRWRLGALGLGLALAGTMLSSAVSPLESNKNSVVQELRAQRLVLVDGDDQELGVLEVDGKGNPQLLLRRESRIGLLNLTGPGLLIRDGRRGAYLGLNSQGASVLELTGDDLTQGARVSVQKDGSTGFYVLDDKGRRRAGLEWLSSGHAQFSAFDEAGTLRVQSGVDSKGNASTALYDPTGLPRLGMVVPEEGAPVLAAEDARGHLRAQLTQADDGTATLEFLNPLGETYWSKPD